MCKPKLSWAEIKSPKVNILKLSEWLISWSTIIF